MIALNNINKSFQDGEKRVNHVLRDLSLQVADGEFVAIKGASGAGKTTLLNILGTLLKPDSGSYRLDGKDLTATDMDLAAIRNAKIGFVFQDHRLMPQFDVLQNILLPTLATKNSSTAEEVAYAQKLMELTHIASLAHQYPVTLSGGESSRVAVCRALVMKPAVLLADEPTGQLDRENALNIAQLLADMNKELHTTIVMVTHSDEVSSVADRVLNLKEGKIA
jgi:ABC-type lipoprotein export system ATPase subunit